MIVSCIYGEVNQHEVWKCECEKGIFYIDTHQGVVHWNYPEIIPTQELIEEAKSFIEQKKRQNYLRRVHEYERI